MEYMFLLYAEPDCVTSLTPTQRQAAMEMHAGVQQDAKSRGAFRSAGRLEMPAKTLTVMRSKGAITAKDGPYAETKEFMGGYYLMDCADAGEARQWAERLAQVGCITTVEIRPMMQNA